MEAYLRLEEMDLCESLEDHQQYVIYLNSGSVVPGRLE